MKKLLFFSMTLLCLAFVAAPISDKYKVENVRVEKDYPETWVLKGMIRNTSSRPIRGAVKIKFLKANGDIVHSSRAKVNDGDEIQPGKAASFKYATNPKNFSGVVDYDIEFYER